MTKLSERSLIRKIHAWVIGNLLMCYGVMTCPRCGEWLDEFQWDDHVCRLAADNKVEEETKLEKPAEIRVKKR